MLRKVQSQGGEEIKMDYLVALAAAAMIALYAFIISRCLPKN